MKINKNAMIRSYAQSIGIEAAKELITKKIKDAALEEKENYTEEEVAKICGELAKEGVLIRIVAQNFVVQLERKRSEEQALLLDNIGTQIWYLTVKETYGAVNKAHAEFLGLEKEKLEGRDLYDIISVEEADVCIANNREVFEKKKQSHTEEWVKNGRGETRLLSITRTPKIDDNGNVEYVICAAEDITERKQAEHKLQKSEEKFRAVLNAVPDLMIVLDAEGRYRDIFTADPGLLIVPADQLLGKTIHDVMPEKNAQQIQNVINQTLSTGKLQQIEYVLDVDGGDRWFAGRVAKFMFQNSECVLWSVRDITERKQAEEALRNSEERLARAIEGNSLPTFLIDSNHFITHWNKSCENLTGISAAEIVGTRKAWSAFYAEEKPVLADLIVDEATEEEIAGYYEGKYNKSILGEGAYECEDFFPGLGEKGKWLFFTASPLKNLQGTVVGAIATFQDITERRSVEEQLRQSHKMEAVGTLAGGIAHDFNNLLTVIIGNAQLALMDVTKDESLRNEIEDIKKAGEKAASLTRQLLDFSRKQVMKTEVLDLNEKINEIEKMLKRTIGENIDFQTVLGLELWKVCADPGQINQIIMNIVINARDAMPQGGKLTIETANAELDGNYFRERGIEGEKLGRYVMLTVSDTGIGMDKETREHIFEPFFTTKEVGKGTGLGLSTAYGIVKQNNGFIWVYSEPGKGTTFKIYLPRVKGDVEPEEKEQTPVDDPGGSETVLIVEDDDGLRKFAQKVLLQHGYRVLDAENGEDALRVIQAHEGQIDLMITDVIMPKMGGKKLAERLQPLYPQMKLIYMSGYTDNAILHHGVLAPELNFLEKPFSPESLARKVREALDQEIVDY